MKERTFKEIERVRTDEEFIKYLIDELGKLALSSQFNTDSMAKIFTIITKWRKLER